MTHSLISRPRRLRYNSVLRDMVKETRLHLDNFIMPLFIKHGKNLKIQISSMPEQFQFSIDTLEAEIKEIVNLGIKSVILFGVPEKKDAIGSDSLSDEGIIAQAIKQIKKLAPNLLVVADVCMCEYTDHGHCGIIANEDVHNDQTLPILAKQALTFVQAGADIVAPSGMIDGMVGVIRESLDDNNYDHIPILSYSIKYASALYGPFRVAAEGAPKFGDRRSYQADYCNINEAVKEVALDIEEGADMVMVKPAHTYLDVIHKIKQIYPEIPLAAYHTSGEYAMIKAACQNGWLNEEQAVIEILTAIKRAGADIIISYYTKYLAKIL
ncbi:MAG: porphobilinogen synthase [Alphaproteobacteria bacterium]|jgi:porphobilinogen synthase